MEIVPWRGNAANAAVVISTEAEEALLQILKNSESEEKPRQNEHINKLAADGRKIGCICLCSGESNHEFRENQGQRKTGCKQI